MARVVLAMSGGVDSSASAWLLKEQGYEVIGVFMRTGVAAEEGSSAGLSGRGCCSAVDAGDARRVADRLDIPFYALDFEAEFGRIMDYFADEYLSGRTPNPCVVCNSWLKFGQLWTFARQLGADRIATGHYARIVHADQVELHRAGDPDKDQSYVLWGISREILPYLLFPLGDYRKSAVRELARRVGLTAVADKPDSVEICFVPDGDHARVVRSRRPGRVTEGPVVDRAGRALGRHDGYERYTIGQRKGLGIAGERKRYVLEIIPESRTIVLGDREDLLVRGLTASQVNWLCPPPEGPLRCQVKIRYRHPGCAGTVVPAAGGHVRVEFAEPQAAVTPGQAVVFYDGSRLLGGAWIDRSDP